MRFGQGLIQSLINPSYGQGLFNVGAQAGQLAAGVPQQVQRAAEQRRQQEQAAMQGMLTAAQTGVLPTQVAPGTNVAALIDAVEVGRSRAAAQQEIDRETKQREALTRFLEAQNQQELADLARNGVVTPDNYKDFLPQKGEKIKLGPGDILVGENGRIIASNPKTGGLEGKDYSLTSAEVETYESILKQDDTLVKAISKPSFSIFGWDFGGNTDQNKKRILIDEAERIRTNNPKLSKEQALRQAARITVVDAETAAETAPNDWYNSLDADTKKKVDAARANGYSDAEIRGALNVKS